MISDNGKTFKEASKLLLNIVKRPEVEHCLSQTRIRGISIWKDLHGGAEFSKEW